MTRKLRLAVIVDPISAAVYDHDPDKEIQEHLREVQELTAITCELVVSGVGMHIIKDHKLDLLIIDYGGMSQGAGDTCEWQVRAACEWAENHPGSLMLLWTAHTKRVYKWELEKQFGHLNNIQAHYFDFDNWNNVPDWVFWFVGGDWEPYEIDGDIYAELTVPERQRGVENES